MQHHRLFIKSNNNLPGFLYSINCNSHSVFLTPTTVCGSKIPCKGLFFSQQSKVVIIIKHVLPNINNYFV